MLEPIHGQVRTPSEARASSPAEIPPRYEHAQFRIGDVPGKVDDAVPFAPRPRHVIVIQPLPPDPIVPRTIVEVEDETSGQCGIQRHGAGYPQRCETQVHHLVAP